MIKIQGKLRRFASNRTGYFAEFYFSNSDPGRLTSNSHAGEKKQAAMEKHYTTQLPLGNHLA